MDHRTPLSRFISLFSTTHELPLQLFACEHLAVSHYVKRRLLEAEHLPYRRSSQDIQVCLAPGLQAVILQAQCSCGIVRHKIESCLNLARSSHVRRVANVSRHLLLIIASEWIKGIGNIVLGRKNV